MDRLAMHWAPSLSGHRFLLLADGSGLLTDGCFHRCGDGALAEAVRNGIFRSSPHRHGP